MEHSDLKYMTEQEVFARSASHMLNQNEQCTSDQHGCLYRDTAGKMCAAGVFLSDDEAMRFNIGKGWADISRTMGKTKHDDMITELQMIHDDEDVSMWVDLLYRIAERFGVDMVDIPTG